MNANKKVVGHMLALGQTLIKWLVTWNHVNTWNQIIWLHLHIALKEFRRSPLTKISIC